MSLISFLTWMDNLPTSIALRESTWTYPIIESVHSVGICLFVGLTLLWDLRLLGIGLRRIPVSEVWTKLIPWITLGAVIMMATGIALFYSKPLFFWSNIFFRMKLWVLLWALLNAMAFHFGIERKLVDWDTSVSTPLTAKIAGAISITLWGTVIVFGRFIAYNWFPESDWWPSVLFLVAPVLASLLALVVMGNQWTGAKNRGTV